MRRVTRLGLVLLCLGAVAVAAFQAGVAMGGMWDDLVAPAGALNPIGADGQMTVITDPADYIGCLQADAVGETAVVQFQLPHKLIEEPDDIRPHVHFVRNDAVDNTGTVLFEAKFRKCDLSTRTCGAWSVFAAGSDIVDSGDGANKTGIVGWQLTSGVWGTWDISDVLLMQVKRSGGTSGSVAVCSADTHFRSGPFGSRDPGTR